MDAPQDVAGYEIDKENFRFVAGAASLPKCCLGEEVDPLRTDFRNKVATKRCWTEAVGIELLFEDFKIKKTITHGMGLIIEGNISYLRDYLSSSPEAELLLHSVKFQEIAWCNTCEDGDNGEDEGEEICVSDIADTSGTTALHMAACEPYYDIVKLLSSKGTDVDAIDLDGRSALME